MKRKIYIALIVASAIACMAGCNKQKLEPIASETEIPTVSGETVTELVPIGQEGDVPTSANVSADVQAFLDTFEANIETDSIMDLNVITKEEQVEYLKNVILLLQKYDSGFALEEYSREYVWGLGNNETYQIMRMEGFDETNPLWLRIREIDQKVQDDLDATMGPLYEDSLPQFCHADYPEGNPEGVSGINAISYDTNTGNFLFPIPDDQYDYIGWDLDDYIWDYIQSKFPGLTGVYDAWFLPETYNEGQDFLTIDVRVEDVKGQDYVLTFFYNFTVHGVTITCPELDK